MTTIEKIENKAIDYEKVLNDLSNFKNHCKYNSLTDDARKTIERLDVEMDNLVQQATAELSEELEKDSKYNFSQINLIATTIVNDGPPRKQIEGTRYRIINIEKLKEQVLQGLGNIDYFLELGGI